jgi:hypothetical protein
VLPFQGAGFGSFIPTQGGALSGLYHWDGICQAFSLNIPFLEDKNNINASF